MTQDEIFNKWRDLAKELQTHGYQLPQQGVQISIPDAYPRLVSCYKFCLSEIGKPFVPQPELQHIATWLTDNHGKGLFIYGFCGTGKTFLVRYVLPLMFKAFLGKITAYYDMPYASRHTDEVLQHHILILDDLGTEQRFNDFGTIRNTFDEVIDAAEKYGKLIIVTTNLTAEELLTQYGERVLDRIRSTMFQVLYDNKHSFRKS